MGVRLSANGSPKMRDIEIYSNHCTISWRADAWLIGRVILGAHDRDSRGFPGSEKYDSLSSEAAIRRIGGWDERSDQDHPDGAYAG
jgi:hypothetical protein